TTQLISSTWDWTKIINGNDGLLLFYADVAKAFDRVPHRLLLHKLETYGVSGLLLNWISAFLANRSQNVVVNDCMSSSGPVSSGVIQGSLLGPPLFLIYINDLPEIFSPSVNCRLFADDTKIFAAVKDKDSFLDDCLAYFSWCDKWKLDLAKDKCV